jgi:AraC-like DNA-binding protein
MIKIDVTNLSEFQQPVSFYSPGVNDRPTSVIDHRTHIENHLFAMDYRMIETPDFTIHDMTTSGKKTIKMEESTSERLPLSLNCALKGSFACKYAHFGKGKDEIWQENSLNAYSVSSMSGYMICAAGSEIKQFAISFSEPFFRKLAAMMPNHLERMWERYDNNCNSRLFDCNRECTPDIQSTICQLCRIKTDGECARLLLESKVLELLAFTLAPKRENAVTCPLSAADREKIMEARNILLQDVCHPPSLSKLALQAGTNEFKLKHGFRELFGNTVYGVLTKQRMNQACNCLHDTSFSVADIAVMTGFEHQSSFTKAFRRILGMTPQEYRNNG